MLRAQAIAETWAKPHELLEDFTDKNPLAH